MLQGIVQSAMGEDNYSSNSPLRNKLQVPIMHEKIINDERARVKGQIQTSIIANHDIGTISPLNFARIRCRTSLVTGPNWTLYMSNEM
jgi:hypothetical protein